jgi:hypothetical protein
VFINGNSLNDLMLIVMTESSLEELDSWKGCGPLVALKPQEVFAIINTKYYLNL